VLKHKIKRANIYVHILQETLPVGFPATSLIYVTAIWFNENTKAQQPVKVCS
jgi:hypothetical protein